MRRTQIYITDEQERLLAARAADGGVAKAEVIRRILDRALGLADEPEARREAIRATAGLLPDADDWPEWLAGVRGGPEGGSGAADRLDRLGRAGREA